MGGFPIQKWQNSTKNLPFFALILSYHFYRSILPAILYRLWPPNVFAEKMVWNKFVSISIELQLWTSIFHFFKFEFFQFYNWPREISRDDVTKINLLWIKITFLDYLTPFIPNGLTIPLRPSSALNQEIQSAFGFVSACPPNPDSPLYHFCSDDGLLHFTRFFVSKLFFFERSFFGFLNFKRKVNVAE